MSTERTLPNILRHIAEQVINNDEPMSVPLAGIVQNLDPDNAPSPGSDELEESIAALKKRMTKSYITITINRMKDVKALGKSATVRFFTDDDRGLAMMEVGLKEGSPMRDKATSNSDRKEFKRGYVAGLDTAISFVPDFVEYSEIEMTVARRLLVEFRAHLAAHKDGLK